VDIVRKVKQLSSDDGFKSEIVDFLVRICGIDTTPNPDIAVMREREKRVFDIIKQRLEAFSFSVARIVEQSISPEIEKHSAYTKPYFTKTPSRPEGLPAIDVYKDRHNLLYLIDGISPHQFSGCGGKPADAGRNTAVNAHIDTVAPFFPPEKKRDYIYGRGTADDKGNIAVMYGALYIIDRLAREEVITLKNSITAMFVAEEETGGNGSLALALDKELKKRYDSLLVLEAAGNNIYPANRGAVWFKCELKLDSRSLNSASATPARPTTADRRARGDEACPARGEACPAKGGVKQGNGLSLLEGMIFAVLRMQDEGDKIKAESNHPLFIHRPVQTCNGILGPFGEHPSRICGKVSFVIRGIKDNKILSKLKDAIDVGLEKYIKKYGDKTKIINGVTGKKKVDRHLDIEYLNKCLGISKLPLTLIPPSPPLAKGGASEELSSKDVIIAVYGSTGHMGSILENDDAIIKWAYIGRKVIELKLKEKLDFQIELADFDSSENLILEGGQGFLPTHNIEEIQERMRSACVRGVKEYLNLFGLVNVQRTRVIARDEVPKQSRDCFAYARNDVLTEYSLGLDGNAIDCVVTYDKLHNAAFDGDPASPSMKEALRSGIDVGIISKDAPVRGWDVSCDARLFATEYPGMPVITAGAGELKSAHADDEHISIPDLLKAIQFTTLFLLRETGSIV